MTTFGTGQFGTGTFGDLSGAPVEISDSDIFTVAEAAVVAVEQEATTEVFDADSFTTSEAATIALADADTIAVTESTATTAAHASGDTVAVTETESVTIHIQVSDADDIQFNDQGIGGFPFLLNPYVPTESVVVSVSDGDVIAVAENEIAADAAPFPVGRTPHGSGRNVDLTGSGRNVDIPATAVDREPVGVGS